MGTTPGQDFYISGPGHGDPALVANTYLEGTYSEIYPNVSQNEAGLKKLFKQFSFPGGIPSHVAPGSILEGGELGYSLSYDAFGAVFGNPDLIVACVIGNGEAETGPLATACIIPHPFYAAQESFIQRLSGARHAFEKDYLSSLVITERHDDLPIELRIRYIARQW